MLNFGEGILAVGVRGCCSIAVQCHGDAGERRAGAGIGNLARDRENAGHFYFKFDGFVRFHRYFSCYAVFSIKKNDSSFSRDNPGKDKIPIFISKHRMIVSIAPNKYIFNRFFINGICYSSGDRAKTLLHKDSPNVVINICFSGNGFNLITVVVLTESQSEVTGLVGVQTKISSIIRHRFRFASTYENVFQRLFRNPVFNCAGYVSMQSAVKVKDIVIYMQLPTCNTETETG